VAGLLILKHMHSPSDEALCARRLENPYYQFFCGELGFCRRLPFDRSLLTYWRQRLGEDELAALEQESLAAAQEQGAGEPRSRTGGDRHDRAAQGDRPPDRCAALPPGLGQLVDLTRRHSVPLRQSYRRLAKRASIMVGRYSYAHQFRRARRELKFLRTRLGRVIRDIRRKIAGRPQLETRFADLLALAMRVRFHDHRQRGPKV
jgi:IS5 family transposase